MDTSEQFVMRGCHDNGQGLAISEFSRQRMAATDDELRQERDAIAELLG